MAGTPEKPEHQPTREERLAAKLRENLRKRKAQARAAGSAIPGPSPDARDGENESGVLFKTPPKS
ncbi:hypothetical protein B2G71_12940 [Novosphingobium sp. PC22D]|uniref:hypothetical protein n=1 Tax=Novosphingobium sp. PC22D TaxID=1962403 RepID=UPI000BF1AD49|nr:hypothetical protein [Novosphingobium sp. PC22D]PEQ12052.1 hypothetical protein B2G71_12940 [Novosphingobium sp. PC22D]